MQNGKVYLITGATGSLGSSIVNELLKCSDTKIIVFSRDEFKQIDMRRNLEDPRKQVRYFVGDIRDKERMMRAFDGVDFVIHCAALKHVDTCEYNPIEAIKTNVLGAQNIIECAIDRNVKKVLAVSSDKAVNPINLYGATKLCADKLFLAANSYVGKRSIKFGVIRFGNFYGSRGSVVPYWETLVENGCTNIPITDMSMRRYWIDLDEAAKRALEALGDMTGGETFIPKMPERQLWEIAKDICETCNLIIIGPRKGEKLSEELWTDHDKLEERGKFWVIRS